MYQYRIIYSDELAHHGILGMKWGIRRFQNKDGSLTSEGRERYGVSERVAKKVTQTVHDSYYNEDISNKVFSMVGADKKKLALAREQINKGVEEYKEITKQQKELFKDLKGEILTQNEVVSEIAEYANYYYGDKHQHAIEEMTLEEIGNNAWESIYGDGQQQSLNAYSLYTNKNPELLTKVNKLEQKSEEAHKAMRDGAKAIIDDALTEVGAHNISASIYKNSTYKIGSVLVNRMINKNTDDWDSISSGPWYVAQANHKLTPEEAINVSKAEKIIKKFDNYGNAETWAYVNGAVERLGLSDEKASGLSQSDWDRINAEIKKMREAKQYY